MNDIFRFVEVLTPFKAEAWKELNKLEAEFNVGSLLYNRFRVMCIVAMHTILRSRGVIWRRREKSYR